MTPKQRREFKAKAHALKPVAMIGAKGVTDTVITEINVQLEHHELIKIKIAADRDNRKAIAESICEQLQAQLVDIIGGMVIVYRQQQAS